MMRIAAIALAVGFAALTPLPGTAEAAPTDDRVELLDEALGASATDGDNGVELTSPPEESSPGINPFIPIGIALIGLGVGVFALVRSRRHEEVASTDGLTGLKSRRRFDIDVDERERRGAQPTAMLMIDVDHFKTFNDAHGHAVGDEVLRLVGNAIGTQVRKDDVAYRYGGEEFSVLLPNTEHETAIAVAERIRDAITRIELPVRGRVTASVGVASGPASGVAATIQDADVALFKAKRAGRNQVAVG